MFTSAISCPVAFEVTSGEILYGQVHCILEGSASPEVDGVNGPVRRPGHALQEGDALPKTRLRYRVPALLGTWSTSKIFTHVPTNTRKKPVPVGFVIHHSSASPVDYLKRAAAIGASEGNQHQDREIVFVSSKEWGYAHGSRATINQSFGTHRPYDAQELDALRMGRIIVLDSSAVNDFRESLQRTYLEPGIYTMGTGHDGMERPYGVHLPTTAKPTKAGPRKEDESAWLCFNGNEVVAIVYDPTSALSKAFATDDPTSFMLDNNDIGLLIEEEDTSIDMDDADDSDFEEADTSAMLESDEEEEAEDSDEDMETERDALGVHFMYKDPTSLAESLPPPTISSVAYVGLRVLNVKGDTLLFANGAVAGGLAAEVNIITNYEVNLVVAPGVFGHVEVFVATPSGVSNSLMVQVPPVTVVIGVDPSTAPVWGGSLVTLTGYNLDKTTSVSFGDISALEVETRSSTEITAILPAGDLTNQKATSLPISIQSEYEALPVAQQFWYNHLEAPTDPTYRHALATWRNARLMRPNDLTPYKCLDRVFSLLSDHTSRIELWRDLADKASGETRLYALRSLAAAYIGKNDLSGAVASWEKAVALGDDDKQVYEGLIGAYEISGKHDLADKLRQGVCTTLN